MIKSIMKTIEVEDEMQVSHYLALGYTILGRTYKNSYILGKSDFENEKIMKIIFDVPNEKLSDILNKGYKILDIRRNEKENTIYTLSKEIEKEG